MRDPNPEDRGLLWMCGVGDKKDKRKEFCPQRPLSHTDNRMSASAKEDGSAREEAKGEGGRGDGGDGGGGGGGGEKDSFGGGGCQGEPDVANATAADAAATTTATGVSYILSLGEARTAVAKGTSAPYGSDRWLESLDVNGVEKLCVLQREKNKVLFRAITDRTAGLDNWQGADSSGAASAVEIGKGAAVAVAPWASKHYNPIPRDQLESAQLRVELLLPEARARQIDKFRSTATAKYFRKRMCEGFLEVDNIKVMPVHLARFYIVNNISLEFMHKVQLIIAQCGEAAELARYSAYNVNVHAFVNKRSRTYKIFPPEKELDDWEPFPVEQAYFNTWAEDFLGRRWSGGG